MGVFIRTVRTKSGATAVQIVEKRGAKILNVQHFGSAHTAEELALLKATAESVLHPGQQAFDFEIPITVTPEPPAVVQPVLSEDLAPSPAPARTHDHALAAAKTTVLRTSSQILWTILSDLYDEAGFNIVQDETFKKLVLARIMEPVSKEDSIRVLNELGIPAPGHATIHRSLARCAEREYQNLLAKVAFARAAPALSLLLYDVTTLYFEAQKEDEFRKPGISKERRLEPQIVVGLLVDQNGYPLELHCFERNKAEITTMIPVVEAFLKRHGLTGVTIVADAGMMSAGNIIAMEEAGLKFIVGSRIHKLPAQIDEYLDKLLAEELEKLKDQQAAGNDLPENHTESKPSALVEPIVLKVQDGKIFEDAQPVQAGRGKDKITRTYRLIFQFRIKRARLDLRNIQKQIDKSNATLSGTRPVKKDKYVKVTETHQELDKDLIQKHQRRAGFKGYVTNLEATDLNGSQVIAAYHDLYEVERSFRMSKIDLRGRPIFHHKKDSILAHLSIVFTALAISRTIQARTGLSIRRVLQILRPLRSAVLNINGHEITVPPHIPAEAQTLINQLEGVH